jgi:hypothetical protein
MAIMARLGSIASFVAGGGSPPAPTPCQPGQTNVSICPVGAVTIPEDITVEFAGLTGLLAELNGVIPLTYNPTYTKDIYGLSASGTCYWTWDSSVSDLTVYFATDTYQFFFAQTWYVQASNFWNGGSDGSEYLLDDFPNNGPGYDPCDPRGNIPNYAGVVGTCDLQF